MATCSVCGIPLRPSRSEEPTCLSPSCRQLHRLRAPKEFHRRCLFCSRPAEPDRDTCSGENCRKMHAGREETKVRDVRRREEIDRNTREAEQALRETHGPAVPEAVIRARLPANERTIVPLPEERRAAFASNLAFSIDKAMEDPDRPIPVTPETPAAHAGMIRGGCTACRGSCCRFGGDRAFLYPDHFRLLLRERPRMTREEIQAEYLSRLPERAVHDSCVYHTETGCALPRELRANLCNTFLCGGLEDMIAAQPKEGAPIPVLAFCVRNSASEVVRTSLFDPDGNPILGTS
jgi:hypothetical protein